MENMYLVNRGIGVLSFEPTVLNELIKTNVTKQEIKHLADTIALLFGIIIFLI